MLNAPRAILFDWDETLVNSWGAIWRAINHTREAFGLPVWTLEESHHKINRSMRDVFPDMFGDRWQDAARIFKKQISDTHLNFLSFKPGAVELLDYLAGTHIRIGLVSNKIGPVLREEIAHLQWDHYFPVDFVCGAEDGPTDKPHPDCWHPIRHHFRDLSGKDIWYVGDKPTDMEFAANIGATAIYIHPTVEISAEYQVDAHVRDCDDLMELIKRSLNNKDLKYANR